MRNYIFEIRAFYDWLEDNRLPSGAVALWHALMYQVNKAFWAEEITPSVRLLRLRTGLGEDGVRSARRALCEAGLLEMRELGGRGGTAYRLRLLYRPGPGKTCGTAGDTFINNTNANTYTNTYANANAETDSKKKGEMADGAGGAGPGRGRLGGVEYL